MRLFLFLEHSQHAVGHEKSADHINRGKNDRKKAEHRPQKTVACDEGTHQGNTANGVRATHQGCVQGGWHLGDDLDADKDGEDKNSQTCDDIHEFLIR